MVIVVGEDKTHDSCDTAQEKLAAVPHVEVESFHCGKEGHLKWLWQQKRQLSPKRAAAHKTESKQEPVKEIEDDRKQRKLTER